MKRIHIHLYKWGIFITFSRLELTPNENVWPDQGDKSLEWDVDDLYEECPACNGTAANELDQPCVWCAGSEEPGFVKHKESHEE